MSDADRQQPVVAAFDVDGTLTVRDCVVPFLERLAGRGRLARGLLARPAALVGATVRRDRDRFKALAVATAFTGRDVDEVERMGSEYATTIHAQHLRPDTVARLGWHRSEGHRVVLVSASLGPYLRPLGQLLGVDAVLCTEVASGPDGRYTGSLIDGNCRGPEKERRLRAWMTTARLAPAELWAYGDSNGDREMLLAAHHRYQVKDCVITEVPER